NPEPFGGRSKKWRHRFGVQVHRAVARYAGNHLSDRRVKRAAHTVLERLGVPVFTAHAERKSQPRGYFPEVLDEQARVRRVIQAERAERIIAAGSGNKPEQIIGESVAGILPVEVEAAAGRMRTVIAVNGAVVILVSKRNRVCAGDPVHAGLAVANAAPQAARHSPGNAEPCVSGDVYVRQANPFFAARRWDALNAGLLHQV